MLRLYSFCTAGILDLRTESGTFTNTTTTTKMYLILTLCQALQIPRPLTSAQFPPLGSKYCYDHPKQTGVSLSSLSKADKLGAHAETHWPDSEVPILPPPVSCPAPALQQQHWTQVLKAPMSRWQSGAGPCFLDAINSPTLLHHMPPFSSPRWQEWKAETTVIYFICN